MSTANNEARETMKFEEALECVAQLSKSQGFYGHVLDAMNSQREELGEAFEEHFNSVLKENGVYDPVDLVMLFEG